MLVLAAAFACNKTDLNKDLKPIDPNTPPPKPAGEAKAAPGMGEKPAQIIK